MSSLTSTAWSRGWRRGQFVARLFQPQPAWPASRAPPAGPGRRPWSCRRSVPPRSPITSSISTMTLMQTPPWLDDGMKGGADAPAAGGGGAQRGIEQEGPVVIDRHQHVCRFARRRRQQLHINLAGLVAIQFGQGSACDFRQRGGIPHQNVVGIGAAEQGIKKIRPPRAIRFGGDEGARLGQGAGRQAADCRCGSWRGNAGLGAVCRAGCCYYSLA